MTAHPVNYFPGILGRNIKNCPPSKLFLFTSLLLKDCIVYIQMVYKPETYYAPYGLVCAGWSQITDATCLKYAFSIKGKPR